MKKSFFLFIFLLCELDMCFQQHLHCYCIWHITPNKIAGEWRSVTQGDMFALLTCFHHRSVLWVFTVVTVGPSWWTVLVSLLQQVGDMGRTRESCPQSWLLTEMVHLRHFVWSLYSAVYSWRFFSVQPKHPHEIVNGASRNWRKVLKYNANSWKSLSSPKFTI